MTREELYKSAKSILHEDFCLNGKCSYYGQCERGEGNVAPRKNSCNYDFALSMIIRGIDIAVDNLPSPWISIKEDLPCNHKELTTKDYTLEVLTLDDCNYYRVVRMWKFDGKWIWGIDDLPITHWMALPEMTKE